MADLRKIVFDCAQSQAIYQIPTLLHVVSSSEGLLLQPKGQYNRPKRVNFRQVIHFSISTCNADYLIQNDILSETVNFGCTGDLRSFRESASRFKC